MRRFNVIVCGLGAMGSAALWIGSHDRGGVLGSNGIRPGTSRGSSHGESRIIRLELFRASILCAAAATAPTRYGGSLRQARRARLLHITGIAEIGLPVETAKW